MKEVRTQQFKMIELKEIITSGIFRVDSFDDKAKNFLAESVDHYLQTEKGQIKALELLQEDD